MSSSCARTAPPDPRISRAAAAISCAGIVGEVVGDRLRGNDRELDFAANDATYRVEFDAIGTILAIERIRSNSVKQGQAVAAGLPGEMAREHAHAIADSLIDQLSAGVEALQIAESAHGPITLEYSPMLNDYPVRGYGAIVRFDLEGELLSYHGNWALPHAEWRVARQIPGRMIMDIVSSGARSPDEFEVAWFEVGGRLELLTRTRYGPHEDFFRTGLGHPLDRSSIAPERYNTGASLVSNGARSIR